MKKTITPELAAELIDLIESAPSAVRQRWAHSYSVIQSEDIREWPWPAAFCALRERDKALVGENKTFRSDGFNLALASEEWVNTLQELLDPDQSFGNDYFVFLDDSEAREVMIHKLRSLTLIPDKNEV